MQSVAYIQQSDKVKTVYFKIFCRFELFQNVFNCGITLKSYATCAHIILHMNYSTNILKLILWLLCKFWYILTLADVHNKLVSTLTEGSVLFLFLSRFQYERYTKYFTFIVTNRLLKLTRHKRFIKQYQTNQYILLTLISYKYHSSWSILVQKVYKYVDVSVFAGRDSINISTTP